MQRVFADPIFSQDSRFLGSKDDLAAARMVLFGAPLDGTVSFWPGARFGPGRIRNVSHALEEYSPALDRDLSTVPFYDAGDLEIPLGNTASALHAIGAAVRREALGREKIPFVLGGEHLVSLPVVEAVYEEYPDLAVLQFDAHADLRDAYMGEAHSHATVMRRICDLLSGKSVYQFGIRSGTREEFRFGQENTRFFPYDVVEPVRRVLPELQDRPVYVTVDIDVVDPGFAPGTSTPEPGGCTPRELIAALHELAGLHVVGFDLVELCPLAEVGAATSVLAAKLVREAILSFVH